MMTNEVLNWNPTDDKFSKPKEIEIHLKLHDKKSSESRTAGDIWGGKRLYRINALEKALSKFNKNFTGKVLEVGAGDGWCSAYIAKNKDITNIYSMECNSAAVEKLIPQTFKILGVPQDKLNLVLGSFNDIRVENYFDSVVAMGALHHSANLLKTFKEIYKSLKPGGFLIAQEPYMDNSIQNDYYFRRENENYNFWGMGEIKNHERTDLFYRLCEYQTAAYHAGFNFDHFKIEEKKTFSEWFRKKGVKAQAQILPQNLVLVLVKPENDYIPPTAWM